MSFSTLGILHPGAMGATIAGSALGVVTRVLWASAGRSGASRARGERQGLEDAGTVAALVQQSEVLVSVCPPAAAEALAAEVAALGFRGLFVDANAVSPERARTIGRIITNGGGRFVDGGIIGGPVQRPGTTRLYLSGDEADAVAACYAGSNLEAIVIPGGVGAASALKMVYAAQTKGTTALLAGVLAVARREGVEQALMAEWEAHSYPGLYARAGKSLEGAAPKAWRWVGEMEEIAATFEQAGLPDGVYDAAAELYRRLEQHADADPPPAATALIDDLLKVPQAAGA